MSEKERKSKGCPIAAYGSLLIGNLVNRQTTVHTGISPKRLSVLHIYTFRILLEEGVVLGKRPSQPSANITLAFVQMLF